MALEPAVALIIGLVVLSQIPSVTAVAGIALVVAAGVGAARTGGRTRRPARGTRPSDIGLM
jgi:inner membrane transporter RhtA